jgi:hypothetical protein
MTLQEIVDGNLSIHVHDIAQHPGLAKDMQLRLIDLGIVDPPADGQFGPISRLGLRQFVKLTGVGDPLVVDKALAGALLAADADTLLPITLGADLASRIVRCMQEKKHWIARLPGYVNIVYVEGANEDGSANANTPDRFNDRRIVLTLKSGAPKILGNWQATTEPGNHFTMNPVHALGAGRIQLGQYKAWNVGIHTGLSGGNSHEGLLQAVSISICRDKNKDFKRKGDFVDTNNDGFNQHHASDRKEHLGIGKHGAGCLVGRRILEHEDFMKIVKSDPRFQTSNGYKFMTTVVEVADLPA